MMSAKFIFEARQNKESPWVWEIWDVGHPTNHYPIALIDSKGAADDLHADYAATMVDALNARYGGSE